MVHLFTTLRLQYNPHHQIIGVGRSGESEAPATPTAVPLSSPRSERERIRLGWLKDVYTSGIDVIS